MRHLITACAASLLLITACAPPTVNTGTVSGSAANGAIEPASQAAEQKAPPTWGQSYTWPNKVAVQVDKPAECKPGKYAQPQGVKRAVKVKITITNGSDKPIDTASLSFLSDVQVAGAKADSVFDSNGPCAAGTGMESATVLPGKAYSYTVAYAAAQPGEMQIALQYEMGGDKAVFVGPA